MPAWVVTIIWPFAQKLLWWALPKIMDVVTDYVKAGLKAVARAANDIPIAEGELAPEAVKTRRRAHALGDLAAAYPNLPEWLHRPTIEHCVRWQRLGVDVEMVDQIEDLVVGLEDAGGTGAEKRKHALETIRNEIAPQLGEGVARELVDFLVGRLKTA